MFCSIVSRGCRFPAFHSNQIKWGSNSREGLNNRLLHYQSPFGKSLFHWISIYFFEYGKTFHFFFFFCAHGTLNVAALWHSVVVKGGKLTQRRRHLIRIESANVLTLYPYQHKDQLGEWSIRKRTLSFNLQFFAFFRHNFDVGHFAAFSVSSAIPNVSVEACVCTVQWCMVFYLPDYSTGLCW